MYILTCTPCLRNRTHMSIGQHTCSGQVRPFPSKKIAAYLEPYHSLGGNCLGPFFTGLCCFMWCVYVTLEVRDAVNVMRAAVYLKGPCTTIGPAGSPDEPRITVLSTPRVVFFLGVQMLRIAIAVALLIGGLQFLVGTFNMSDLLLSTV